MLQVSKREGGVVAGPDIGLGKLGFLGTPGGGGRGWRGLWQFSNSSSAKTHTHIHARTHISRIYTLLLKAVQGPQHV